MRRLTITLILILLFVAIFTACSQNVAPITPATDRLTFLYFYTEN